MVPPRYFSGLDLGQATDPSAFVAVEQRPAPVPTPRRRWAYTVVWLRRWHLGTRYDQVAADMAALYQRPPLPWTWLVIDYTGVGRPVAEQLKAAGVEAKTKLLTITAGDKATEDPKTREFHVPKRELVSHGIALFQSGLVQVAPVPDVNQTPDQRARNPSAASDLFRKELSQFVIKQSRSSAHESFEAEKAGQHDDLVMAFLMAVWLGERLGGGSAAGITVQSEDQSAVGRAPAGVFA